MYHIYYKKKSPPCGVAAESQIAVVQLERPFGLILHFLQKQSNNIKMHVAHIFHLKTNRLINVLNTRTIESDSSSRCGSCSQILHIQKNLFAFNVILTVWDRRVNINARFLIPVFFGVSSFASASYADVFVTYFPAFIYIFPSLAYFRDLVMKCVQSISFKSSS